MNVSVIIPALNAAETIAVQISALSRQQTTRTFEVIVADNGSVDATVSVARQAADGLDVQVVDASDRTGAAHARNCGVAIASSQVLLFCDADDQVDDGWLDTMARAVEDHCFVGGGLDRRRFSSAPGTLLAPVTDRLHRTVGGQEFAVTANLGVSRDLFDQIGGFDPCFIDGSEDVDFAIRCAATGTAPCFVDGAIVHYREVLDHRQLFSRHRSYGRSEPQLWRKHQSVLPRRGVSAAIRFWSKLALIGCGSIWSASRRDTALRMAGRGVGRIEGSIRYRVVFL